MFTGVHLWGLQQLKVRNNYTEYVPKKNVILYIITIMIISLEVIFFLNFVKNPNTKKKITFQENIIVFKFLWLFLTRDNGQSS